MIGEPVPRFYFDLHTSREDVPDREGTELPGADVACSEAADSVVEMLRGNVRPDGGELSIRVRDETGSPVCEVRAQVRVTRH